MKRESENVQVAGSRRWRAALHDNGPIPVDRSEPGQRGRLWAAWLIMTGVVLLALATTILATA